MAKEKNWSFEANNQKCEVTLVFNNFSGRHKLSINGKEVVLKIPFKANFVGLDHEFVFENTPIHLVVLNGNKADLAVNGVYLDSGKPYEPLKKMPGWAWVFIIACMLIPVVALGGALPFIIGFGGAVINARIASNERSTAQKIAISVITTAVCWGLYLLVVYTILSIQ